MNIVSITPVFNDPTISRFNVAVWSKKGSDNFILIGRELTKKSPPGEPDIGKLVLFEMDRENRIVHQRVIWEPLYESFYLEDPRALINKEGQIVIGLTAVLRTKKGIQTFPSIVPLAQGKILPPLLIIIFFLGPTIRFIIINFWYLIIAIMVYRLIR